MDRRGGAAMWIVLLAVAFIAYQYVYLPSQQQPSLLPATPTGNSILASSGPYTIAFWNLQVFGTSKANDPEKLEQYVDVLKNYDIIAVQEIRDVTGQAWSILCERMSRLNYSCSIGEREGSTVMKEQYGLLYRIGQVIQTRRVSAAVERPPTAFVLFLNNQTYTIAVVHVKPEAAESELTQLRLAASTLARTDTRVIFGGDMNSDCSYYKEPFHHLPDYYNLQIADSIDTTVGMASCTYDRIFTTDGIEVLSSGATPITTSISDHYPVWIAFNA